MRFVFLALSLSDVTTYDDDDDDDDSNSCVALRVRIANLLVMGRYCREGIVHPWFVSFSFIFISAFYSSPS